MTKTMQPQTQDSSIARRVLAADRLKATLARSGWAVSDQHEGACKDIIEIITANGLVRTAGDPSQS